MAGLLGNIVFSFVDLVRQTILLGIPVFILAFIGKKIHASFSKDHSWLKATVFSTYILFFVLIMLVYFVPFFLGRADFNQGAVPETLGPSFIDELLRFIVAVLRVGIVSAMLSALVLPFIFLGTAISESVQKRTPNKIVSFAGGVFGSVFVGIVAVLFLLPAIGIDVVAGTIYLIYFA